MLSRPLSSGWKPAPSSRSAATRPCTVTRPWVGVSKRVASLSRVLLPEPLAPMTPRASPGATAKVTSRSAQNSSRQPRRWKRWTRASGRERARSWWIVKRLATPSKRMAGMRLGTPAPRYGLARVGVATGGRIWYMGVGDAGTAVACAGGASKLGARWVLEGLTALLDGLVALL